MPSSSGGKFLQSKAEQIFYTMFLIVIAGFYLAFVAYFGVTGRGDWKSSIAKKDVCFPAPETSIGLPSQISD